MQTAGAPEWMTEAAKTPPAQRRFRPTRAMWFYLAAVGVLYGSAVLLPAREGRPVEGIAGILWSGYREAAAMLAELLPYWLAGMLVGAALTTLLSRDQLSSRLGGGGIRASLAAAATGAVVPICSCSVVPVLAGMVGAGVPLGPAVAFLIAAPMLNAQAVVLTAGALGWPLTAARVAATFGIALAAASLLRWWQTSGGDPARLLRLSAAWPGGTGCSRLPSGPATAGWREKGAELLRTALRRLIELNGYLLFAVLLAAALRVLVPERWIEAALGGSGPGSVVISAALAIPVYVCTYAEVPTAMALASKGMGPGATLAYLLGGPGLSAASIAMLSAVFRARLIVVYVALSFAGCVLAGWIYNRVA